MMYLPSNALSMVIRSPEDVPILKSLPLPEEYNLFTVTPIVPKISLNNKHGMYLLVVPAPSTRR